MKGTQIDGVQMRAVAAMIKEVLPEGLGFAFFTFETGESDTPSNYISNCDRGDMIKAIKETVERLEAHKDFKIHEIGSKVVCISCTREYPDSLAIRSKGCTHCGGILVSS